MLRERKPRGGFTLAELMVVIAVIALVAAILVPYLYRVYQVQRKVKCASHLEKLGQAYGTQCANRKMQGFAGSGLGTLEWQKVLLPFVSNATQVFQCPEDDGTAMGRTASLANYYMDVYPGGNYAGSVCLNEDENDFIWKLSQTQWDTFRTMAERNGRQSHGYVHPGYKPDNNPNLYYFAFEDMRWSNNPDRDFWDLNFKMETKGVDVTITIVHGVTGYNHYLFLGPRGAPDRQELFDGASLKNCNGQSITVKGDEASNYGMNSVMGKIPPGQGDKIAIMDYNLLLVAGSQFDEVSGDRSEQLSERWRPDPEDPSAPLKFARHLGKCNVLFVDGGVKSMDTDTINPNYITTQEKYWDP